MIIKSVPTAIANRLMIFFWLAVAPFAAADARQQVRQRFDESILSHPQYLSSYDEGYIHLIDDGIRYSWMARGEAFRGSSFKTQYGLRGDFELLFRFQVNELGTPSNGWGSGILLRLDFHDLAFTGISLQRQARPDGRQVVSIDETRQGVKEHRVQSIDIATNREVTGFSLSRSSGQMAVLVLGDDQQELHRWDLTVSESDVFPVGFHVHSGQALADIDVVLQSFDLVADVILQREQVYRPYDMVWRMVSISTAAVMVAALAWRARLAWRHLDSSPLKTRSVTHG